MFIFVEALASLHCLLDCQLSFMWQAHVTLHKIEMKY